MGIRVEFTEAFYNGWITRYPEFNPSVDEALARIYFDESGLYHANDSACHGLPVDEAQQKSLIWMVMAHIAMRYAILNGVAPSPLVGRLNSASEGSVSVGTDLSGVPGTAAWWSQTKYGLDYWMATAQYRTMRYRPGSQPFFGAVGAGGRFGWPFR